MQKENYLTVDQWCDQWFTSNRHKWNGNTEGGYRNLIYPYCQELFGFGYGQRGGPEPAASGPG